MKATQESMTQTMGQMVDRWFADFCRNPYGHYFLYYLPADGPKAGEIAIAEDPPAPGWLLANPTRFGGNWTKERAKAFVWDVWRKLPVLPVA